MYIFITERAVKCDGTRWWNDGQAVKDCARGAAVVVVVVVVGGEERVREREHDNTGIRSMYGRRTSTSFSGAGGGGVGN